MALAGFLGLILWTQLDPCFSQSSDTKVVNNCNSTSCLSQNPVNNMWDYHLFFITTICVVNHPRLINLKIALVSIIKQFKKILVINKSKKRPHTTENWILPLVPQNTDTLTDTDTQTDRQPQILYTHAHKHTRSALTPPPIPPHLTHKFKTCQAPTHPLTKSN